MTLSSNPNPINPNELDLTPLAPPAADPKVLIDVGNHITPSAVTANCNAIDKTAIRQADRLNVTKITVRKKRQFKIVSDLLTSQFKIVPDVGDTHLTRHTDECDITGVTSPLDCISIISSTQNLDDGSDDSIVTEGLPVLDGMKLGAYPFQSDVVAVTNQFITTRATGIWGDYEPMLINKARDYIRDYFHGMELPPIKIGLLSSPRSTYGCHFSRGDHGLLSEIVINKNLFISDYPGIVRTPKTEPGFVRLILDILLHELVHSYCAFRLMLPEHSYQGHGPVFARECNRIGAMLGLDRVRHSKSKRREDKGLKKCNYWPQCVRPADYYLGAVIDDPFQRPTAKARTSDDVLMSEAVSVIKILSELRELAECTQDTAEGHRAITHALIQKLKSTMRDPSPLAHFKTA
jgi:hypothetical protein